MRFIRSLYILFAGILLIGCAPAVAPDARDFILVTDAPNATPSPTPFRPSASTDSPLLLEEDLGVGDIPSPTATAVPIDVPLPVKNEPEVVEPESSQRSQYRLIAELDYAAHTLAVDEMITYTNQTGLPLNELVLAVESNRWPNCFDLKSFSVDGQQTEYRLSGARMDVSLAQVLLPGKMVALSISYELQLPAKRYEEVFGYVGYQTNVVNWYPFIVPYQNGWLLHDPSGVGEHLVYDASDFDVRLKVIGADNLIVAASAEGKVAGDWTLYQLDAARTFAFSVSSRFHVETEAGSHARVTSYSFPGYDAAGQGILEAASRAISIYSDRFAPYPYRSLSIVQTQLPDGMEFDGLIFMGSEFYDDYDGTIKNNLISIGVHEVSHQWWFGSVGSDQALEPWLDEALALYSERIFYETVFPYPVTWWWRFRVTWFSPSGWVDTSIYDGYGFRLYTDAVYLRGAQFLEELRTRIGEKAFNAFLRDYAVTYAQRSATADDFFAMLDRHVELDYSDIVDAYFLNRP